MVTEVDEKRAEHRKNHKPPWSDPGPRFDPHWLIYQSQRRGLKVTTDVLRASGLSRPTVLKALKGEPISPESYARIARAIEERPVIPELDRFLAFPRRSS